MTTKQKLYQLELKISLMHQNSSILHKSMKQVYYNFKEQYNHEDNILKVFSYKIKDKLITLNKSPHIYTYSKEHFQESKGKQLLIIKIKGDYTTVKTQEYVIQQLLLKLLPSESIYNIKQKITYLYN